MLRLWNEETGAIISSEIILVATILVIGIIAGLKSLRDSVVTELADVAQAIANINQSYSFSGASGHHAYNPGSFFIDSADFCDTSTDTSDTGNSKCVSICNNAAAIEVGGT
ncbi:MAG: hypothetical protein K8U03_08075 [Planctomycetia bacterium]|nr:hypothetical protein [Planctomycetia bacterium]